MFFVWNNIFFQHSNWYWYETCSIAPDKSKDHQGTYWRDCNRVIAIWYMHTHVSVCLRWHHMMMECSHGSLQVSRAVLITDCWNNEIIQLWTPYQWYWMVLILPHHYLPSHTQTHTLTSTHIYTHTYTHNTHTTHTQHTQLHSTNAHTCCIMEALELLIYWFWCHHL